MEMLALASLEALAFRARSEKPMQENFSLNSSCLPVFMKVSFLVLRIVILDKARFTREKI